MQQIRGGRKGGRRRKIYSGGWNHRTNKFDQLPNRRGKKDGRKKFILLLKQGKRKYLDRRIFLSYVKGGRKGERRCW